jgi:hypothetical protein
MYKPIIIMDKLIAPSYKVSVKKVVEFESKKFNPMIINNTPPVIVKNWSPVVIPNIAINRLRHSIIIANIFFFTL